MFDKYPCQFHNIRDKMQKPNKLWNNKKKNIFITKLTHFNFIFLFNRKIDTILANIGLYFTTWKKITTLLFTTLLSLIILIWKQTLLASLINLWRSFTRSKWVIIYNFLFFVYIYTYIYNYQKNTYIYIYTWIIYIYMWTMGILSDKLSY